MRIDVASSTGVRHAYRRLLHDVRHARGNKLNREVAREIWTLAAVKLEAKVVVVGSGFFKITRGEAKTMVYEQTPSINNDVAVQLADDKALVYRLLRDAGVQVPEHLEFTPRRICDALAFLEHLGGPCVVKPASGGCRGFGVTSQLRMPADVRRAARWAARFSDRLLIERQVEGVVYRVLVLDGRVLGLVRRNPPSVTGDGHSTIAQLVEAEYEWRLHARGIVGARPLVIDLDSILTLKQAGWSPKSVPEAGETVVVKTVTNQNRLEDNEAVPDPLPGHLCVAAAEAIGLRFAGLDIVTPDGSRPLAESGGVVIDVNARPGLWHHYRVRDPDQGADVAVEILKHLLALDDPHAGHA